MDQFEVTNFNWLEYLYWTKRTYEEFPMIYHNALPDTNAWRSPLAYNEPYVEYYLRHPAYQNYPVVGVSWNQANDFCKWRTDRVNEFILIREGVLTWNPDQAGEPFTTDAYLANQYHPQPAEDKEQQLIDLDPMQGWSGKRKDLGQRIVRMEDGILLPRYRLPTEAEWEFAYFGLVGSMTNAEDPGVIENRRTYPWTGHWVRQDNQEFQGDIRANFVRGRGDYMGTAGALNDAADVTAPVDSYWPNDYGLYHMAGNVSEWVMDVYRPLSHEDFDEFRPFRGNVFKTKVLGNDGVIDEKTTQVLYDVYGIKEYLHEFERKRYQRISAGDHVQKKTVVDDSSSLYPGMSMNVKSRNDIDYYNAPPEQVYLSKNKVKDSIELELLFELNRVVDQAIDAANNQWFMEASEIIQTNIFDGLFDGVDPRFDIQDNLGNTYPLEIISDIRIGMADFIVNTPGKLKWRNVTAEENINRRNYKNSDYKDFVDGDFESSIYYGGTTERSMERHDVRKDKVNQGIRDESLVMYQNDHEEYDLTGTPINSNAQDAWPTTLVSDKSRVYKGGSWRDRAFWIVGSNRRFLDEDQSTSTIGFRCAMDRLGSPKGLGRYR
jgi:formylglycine-generating enzyme required for sulfatase activity